MPAAKLVLSAVTKAYGVVPVLRGIDLSVAEGEMVCLIGASGSGKSTLLRTINLLDPPDDGEILLDGVDIADPALDPRAIRARIGMVFQTWNLFPHMTALANVTLAPRRLRIADPAAIAATARALLARFGLADHAEKYPEQLSGGQQQRVAIVRALAMAPELLLFDEITSSLDPELVAEVLDVLRALRAEGRTMICATHEMGFAREVADRVVMLDGGQVIEAGPPAQVFGNPHHPRTRAFLSAVLR